MIHFTLHPQGSETTTGWTLQIGHLWLDWSTFEGNWHLALTWVG